ncbi:MAG: hypothetical protein HFH16_03795 [Ruminococcus sp.]|uniref:Uncharacterized protein n=2 Tax=Schaedlerella arabinosiphila TaxID=2044587 RepID=A0A3R8JMU2_9FIRM|nr:hypothetical protein [Ruminococcus sp.]MCI9211736.1 hypothetical protein [Ruminococcus sp.]RRK32408.1 hypothetical protein EBB54_14355 [Schaedlerella arabinosiphila]
MTTDHQMGYDNTHQAALSALSNPAVSVKIHQLVVTENSDQQWGHSVLKGISARKPAVFKGKEP